MAIYECLNKFRARRKCSEFNILIGKLPNAVCNIILDYAQLDNGVINRIMSLNTTIKDSHLYVQSLGIEISQTGDICYHANIRMRLHPMTIILIRADYSDIFATCYSDDSNFERQISEIICDWESLGEAEFAADVSKIIKNKIVDYFCWPGVCDDSNPSQMAIGA